MFRIPDIDVVFISIRNMVQFNRNQNTVENKDLEPFNKLRSEYSHTSLADDSSHSESIWKSEHINTENKNLSAKTTLNTLNKS